MASHGDDARRVFNRELLEYGTFVSQTRNFTGRTLLEHPLAKNSEHATGRGGRNRGPKFFFRNFHFCKFVEKLTLVIGFGL